MLASVADQCLDPLFDGRLQTGDSRSFYFHLLAGIILLKNTFPRLFFVE